MAGRIHRVSRRNVLQGMSGLVGAAALGCSGSEAQQQDQNLIACFSGKKKKHALAPRGAFGNVQNIVILMMENRSFDHAFGALSIDPDRFDDHDNHLGGEGRKDVNGLTGDEQNLDLSGKPVRIFRQNKTQLGDLAHEWDNCHRQYDWEGSGVPKNDGFVREHESDVVKGDKSYCATYKYFDKNIGCPPPETPMGIFTRNELPVSYALADQYTLCDNWYASVLGPTWPNRFYLHAGQCRGQKANKPELGMKSI